MPNTLRLKSSLSESEIQHLVSIIYKYTNSLGVPMGCSLKDMSLFVVYAVKREVGNLARNGEFPTNLSNGVFAGILQTGVDSLIEANALTKDSTYRRLCPVCWNMFPNGIHPMYTKRNRKKALKYHKDVASIPSNVLGTATDSLVSIARFIDTTNRAHGMFQKYLNLRPSQVEVYMYHLFGWPRMDAFVRIKGGKGTRKDVKLVQSMPIDLARQSKEVQTLVGPLLT